MSGSEKVIDKIRKLLAMAGDTSSPNEALAAARRARILMDRYQLTRDDIEKQTGDQFLETSANAETSSRRIWMVNLWVAAASLNDCVAGITRAPRVRYLFQGFKSDAIVAKLTMDYLVEACNRACDSSDACGVSEKNFFRVGFSEQVRRRARLIEEDRKQTFVSSSGTALVPLKQKMIEAHFGVLKPMKSINSREPTLDEHMSYLKGVEQGALIGLEKQLNGQEQAKLDEQGF